MNTTAVAQSAIDSMNKMFYNWTEGRWSPSDAWWVSGNALTSLIDYMDKTGSQDVMNYTLHTIKTQRKPIPWWPQGLGDFRADSTDDTGWWAMVMIRMYDLTGDNQYLQIAKEDEAYMYQYWNASICGGGIIQDIRHLVYKNAVSNELYMQLVAALYNRQPNETSYLAKAEATWTWFRRSGMINADNLVNDGLTDSCANNNGTVWSYNQGVILGALVELYEATTNDTYLAEARALADAAVATPLLHDAAGILTESCDAARQCDNNQQMFKGIFARNLMQLNSVLGGDPYRSYVERNAQAAHANARGQASTLYDVAWSGPFVNSSIAKQASVVSLLVSLL
ncbi:hypothetical protein P8C59_008547 [Phyllachora maydis]|uniref:Glycosyl hydrolase n=1 Tax=Phyllachora maydis TaxID=1825666 RepID=A0AAD9ICF1_9PEZI|nr:hypothetical protein P8C59_008547 [Phyllachora maydis]